MIIKKMTVATLHRRALPPIRSRGAVVISDVIGMTFAVGRRNASPAKIPQTTVANSVSTATAKLHCSRVQFAGFTPVRLSALSKPDPSGKSRPAIATIDAGRNKNRLFRAGDRWFESIFLQQRVRNEPRLRRSTRQGVAPCRRSAESCEGRGPSGAPGPSPSRHRAGPGCRESQCCLTIETAGQLWARLTSKRVAGLGPPVA